MFLLDQHFPSICRETFGSHTVARFCVFTPRLVIHWLLCALPFGRTDRKSKALCPQCLQKWDLRPRLSCQLLVATSVYLRESHSHPWAIGGLFHVGKGVDAQGLPSFLFQNGRIEKHLQINQLTVKILERVPFSRCWKPRGKVL